MICWAFFDFILKTSDMPRVLFLMPTKTYRASAFLAAAVKLNIDAVVGSERKQALEVFTPDRTLTLDFSNPGKATQTIIEFAKKHPVNAIIPVDENTAVIGSLASEALDLPRNSPESAIAAREKQRMRAILNKADLPSPDSTVFSTKEEPKELAQKIKYPCVLKPLFLSSSRGVIRANEPAEFISAFKRIKTILSDPEIIKSDPKLSRQILVETFVPGDEVAVEGIFTEGKLKVLAIFDKPDPLNGPYFEETIYVTPSRHPEEILQQLESTVVQASQGMGIKHGAVHAELRINQDGVWLIEIAARSIGGMCSKVLRFDLDMSLEELIIRHAIGEKIEEFNREKQAAGVMMIPIPKLGILKEILGLKQAQSISGIEEIKITIPISQKVVPLPEGNKYLGFIFSRREKPEVVEETLKEAHERLEFVIE